MKNNGIYKGLSQRDQARVRQVATDAGISCSEAIDALAFSYFALEKGNDALPRTESVRNGQEQAAEVFSFNQRRTESVRSGAKKGEQQ